jgi:hypothetical protein
MSLVRGPSSVVRGKGAAVNRPLDEPVPVWVYSDYI